MEVPIYSIKGKASKKSAQLPDAFSEPVRLDLIRKAVRASRANRRQPYGASKGAGFRAFCFLAWQRSRYGKNSSQKWRRWTWC